VGSVGDTVQFHGKLIFTYEMRFGYNEMQWKDQGLFCISDQPVNAEGRRADPKGLLGTLY